MLTVSHLHKTYKLYNKPSDRLLSYLFRQQRYRTYAALQDVNFSLAAGEALGILGTNGAGKSSLLKVLAGVLLAEQGEVEINGKVTGLLELGTGFDANLSGYENIHINGLLIGMSSDAIEAQRQAIMAFSELGDFIYEPMRTYSSGMSMRLAFAIAIHAEPRCFLVDEALSVGDGYFQQKCMQWIRQYRESGGALIFVSHDLNAVKMTCDRVLVMDHGRVVADCDPETGVNLYNRILARENQQEHYLPPNVEQNYGSLKAEIVQAQLFGKDSRTDTVASGEQVQIQLKIQAHEPLPEMTVGIMLRDRFGQDVFGTNSYLLQQPGWAMQKGEALMASFHFDANIAPGKYTLSAALHTEDNHLMECFHWQDRIGQFTVAGHKQHVFSGICNLPTQFDLQQL